MVFWFEDKPYKVNGLAARELRLAKLADGRTIRLYQNNNHVWCGVLLSEEIPVAEEFKKE